MGSGAFGGADHGPQVVGVGKLVADHDEGGLTLFPGGIENIVHGGVFPNGGNGDDPLMGVGDGHSVQLPPVAVHDGDALFPGLGGDVAQSGIGLPLGDIYLVNGGARPEGLDDGVAAFDDAVGLLLAVLPIVLLVHIRHSLPFFRIETV